MKLRTQMPLGLAKLEGELVNLLIFRFVGDFASQLRKQCLQLGNSINSVMQKPIMLSNAEEFRNGGLFR